MRQRTPNHYETLKVCRDASAAEIQHAYRTLAKQQHPDVGGSEEAFKRLVEAARVLSSPGLRGAYDRRLAEDAAHGTGQRADVAPSSAGRQPVTFRQLLHEWDSPFAATLALVILGFCAYRTGVSALVVHAHRGQGVVFGFRWYPNPVRLLPADGDWALTVVKLLAMAVPMLVVAKAGELVWNWRCRQGSFGRRERQAVVAGALVLAVTGPFVMVGVGQEVVVGAVAGWGLVSYVRGHVATMRQAPGGQRAPKRRRSAWS